jgi:hypothetical protein
LLEDSQEEIGDHRIAQLEDLDGNRVDLEFTEKYTREIKNDAAYQAVLETEREFMEYHSLREI